MKYRELLKEGMEELKKAGITDAQIDAEYLLEYVSGMNRASYLMCMMEQAPEDVIERYREFIKMRAAHEPLQYITGEQEFMGMTFHVNSNVLIPRQDTETLVEEALKVVKPGMKVLDMCTGSGCVLISILKNVHGTGGYGYDISKQAINVAKENAKLNDVPAIFERSNLFEDVADETFDVIVSNPPYIRSDEIPFLMPEVSEFEPHEALDGKEDGLFFYRKIIQESPDYLTDGGYLLFEIGYDQGWAVSSMMKEAGFEDVCVKKDLARNDRVVCGHKHLCEKRG